MVASPGLARSPLAAGVCRPVCALCAPGMAGTQASPSPRRTWGDAYTSAEAFDMVALDEHSFKHDYWLGWSFECPCCSDGCCFLEGAAPGRNHPSPWVLP